MENLDHLVMMDELEEVEYQAHQDHLVPWLKVKRFLVLLGQLD